MQKIIKYTILVFVFVGLVLIGIPLHELTHKFDFRNIEKTNEKMCILGCGDAVGYYSFEIAQSEEEEYQRIHRYTEIHAYSITVIWLIISLFILNKMDDFLRCKR